MTTKYISDAQLEGKADRVLRCYEARYDAITGPPVPVERIVEDVLDLGILWDRVPKASGRTILAALDPGAQMVVFNESKREFFDKTTGLYNTVLAHEAGHWEIHVNHGLRAQLPLPTLEKDFTFLYRQTGPGNDRREVQAHKFMGFLLMPSDLLLEAISDVDLLRWPALYELRDRFQVTITALIVRLERLGLLYVAGDRELYRSRQEYEGQLRLGV